MADILYYYGEDNCITGLYAHTLPDIPAGYEYDFIDPYGFVHDIKMDKKSLIECCKRQEHAAERIPK